MTTFQVKQDDIVLKNNTFDTVEDLFLELIRYYKYEDIVSLWNAIQDLEENESGSYKPYVFKTVKV